MTGLDDAVEAVSGLTTRPVRTAWLHQHWLDLSFVHWAVDPAVVAPLLPQGIRPDVHEGAAYVGLIGFRMVGLGFGPDVGVGGVPYLGTFLETNVRLYGVDHLGRRAVVFRSLEAQRLLPVLFARVALRLPYTWARMQARRRPRRARLPHRPALAGPARRVVPHEGARRHPHRAAHPARGLPHRALGPAHPGLGPHPAPAERARPLAAAQGRACSTSTTTWWPPPACPRRSASPPACSTAPASASASAARPSSPEPHTSAAVREPREVGCRTVRWACTLLERRTGLGEHGSAPRPEALGRRPDGRGGPPGVRQASASSPSSSTIGVRVL
ncbi:hypothetical protein GCM10025868_18140 [Angustibacter aerolatus]|uniref:DUF2071 domain-containing protein n=1 Tax=Angustibacter aerolatus TaxID=1162965 RepID=A0ABQ6JFI1_9ACTN|nr:hypothetical protein GCM10025868_18140 [Angustibacter aerolatus]